jgi:hypothetical protein
VGTRAPLALSPWGPPPNTALHLPRPSVAASWHDAVWRHTVCLGIARLAFTDLLIELEATAVE